MTDPARIIIEASVDGIITIDARGIVETVNPAVERMFGYAPSELVGRNVSLLMPEPYRREHDGYIDRYKRTGERRIIGIGREVAARRKDGTVFPVHLAVSEIGEGDARRFVGVIRDISDVKAAESVIREQEAFLNAVFDTVAALVLVLDRDGRLVRFNRACETTSGYTIDEVNAASFFGLLIPPEDRDAVRDLFEELLKTGGPESHENHWVRRDGSRRLIHWAITVLRDAAGQVEFVIGTGLDVTDRRELERQLHQVQKVETIGQLAGGIAHDFNNIITGIAMSAEVLVGRLAADDPAREIGDEIRSSAQRAKDLTRQLLVFSRGQVIEPRPIDFNVLIRDQIETMLRRLIGEDIELAVEPAPRIGPVLLDPGQAQQILLNLVVNARDAMPHGGRVRIATASLAIDPAEANRHVDVKPGRFVSVSVEDQGCGMEEAVKARMFDPFFTTKSDQGTGLGLSTVYAVVRRAGGFIDVWTQPGAGTAVTVFLPEATGATAPAAAETRTIERPLRVLVVEDDAAIRRAIAAALSDRGHRVVEVADPREALSKTDGVELLITDLVMPGMNGRDLAERVRAAVPGVSVLYMSGYAEDRAGRGGPPAPGSVFLQKPFTTEELLDKIAQAMG